MSVAVGGDPVSGIYSAEHLCVFPLIAQSFDKETYSLAQAHVEPGESDGAVSQRSEAVATVGRLAETIGRLAALHEAGRLTAEEYAQLKAAALHAI